MEETRGRRGGDLVNLRWGCGQGILERKAPTPSPVPFLALWPHVTLAG